MQSSFHWFFLVLLLSVVSTLHAASSALRVTCEGSDVGAEVWINNKFRGECPVDLKVPVGELKLLVRKKVDADREQLFQQDIRMGADSLKKVEIKLSAPRLTAAAQRRVEERKAFEHAQELQRQAAERAEAQRREALAESAIAQAIPEFDAALVSGAIKASFRDCADCPWMVAISPGSFEMGSNSGLNNEKPVHRVYISRAFAIGKTEVTQAEWKSIMDENPSNFSGLTGLFYGCSDNCPVEGVSWDDVQVFIRKLNAKTGKQYRLPTEAEWEYACRAGGKNEYCGGDNPASIAWLNAFGGTHPVASKQANAFGLFDMSGNVWEWVEDSYHDSYAGAPEDGSAWQGNNGSRVLRGGAYNLSTGRAASRSAAAPAVRGEYGYIGFRLVRVLP